MRVWAAVLPALGVLVSGCARQAVTPEEPGPGPRPRESSAVIASVGPSPTGTALALGVSTVGPAVSLDRMRRFPDALWLIDLRTSAVRGLTPEADKRWPDKRPIPFPLTRPSWRPDGGALALATAEGRIEVHDVATGVSRLISPEGMHCHTLTWSPDAKRLAFAVSGAERGVSLYTMPADGSAPPRLQVTGLASSVRWWWSPDGRRLRYLVDGESAAQRAGPQSIAESVSSEEVQHAYATAWSPDYTKLAYSGMGDRGTGSQTTVVDASLTPVMTWHDPDEPARGLRWSLDGKQLLIRNASGRSYLLDLARKAGSPVEDPMVAGKEPAGWIMWNGKQQPIFIDEQWKRLVVMESLRGPAYTLVTLGEHGSPSLVLSPTKGN